MPRSTVIHAVLVALAVTSPALAADPEPTSDASAASSKGVPDVVPPRLVSPAEVPISL